MDTADGVELEPEVTRVAVGGGTISSGDGTDCVLTGTGGDGDGPEKAGRPPRPDSV